MDAIGRRRAVFEGSPRLGENRVLGTADDDRILSYRRKIRPRVKASFAGLAYSPHGEFPDRQPRLYSLPRILRDGAVLDFRGCSWTRALHASATCILPNTHELP
jgi:hypothetical protein